MTLEALSSAWDVVVVGAGPAGLAAAATTAAAGVQTLLVDENDGPGGQIYRSVTSSPIKDKKILGDDYWHGGKLVSEFNASGATYVPGATVWTLDRDLQFGLSKGGIARLFSARQVVIATGAVERPMPIPGWTLPGVMTAGAAQTMLKASALMPDGRTVIAGTGPLLWLLAAQLLRAGGKIDAILDTTPKLSLLAALPHLPGFLLSPLLAKGLALTREVRAGVRVVKGVTALSAHGAGKVDRVDFRTSGGAALSLPVDTLLLHQGVVPNVNLAMAAGVKHQWNNRQHAWVPVLGKLGESSIPGIAVAGDGAGIAGALAAEDRGRLAGIAALRALDAGATVQDEQGILQSLQRQERARPFLDVLFEPARNFRIADDATIVCRCEEVTGARLREAVGLGCEGPNQLKSFSRAGMGPCQGRMCGLTVTELIAEQRGVSPNDVGYFRLRPPVKPITLAELARLPVNAEAAKAVS